MITPRFIVGIDLGTTHTVVAFSATDAHDPPAVFPLPQLVTAASSESRPLLASLLYAPLDSEGARDPWGDPPWVHGEYAARRGAEVPGRLVSSAKSWLCHGAVDRLAAILPWGTDDSVPKISPCDASAAYLAHVRRAWDAVHVDAPLAGQDVVLTVPASFDEAARELTLVAAERAGLVVRLIEEPQAAFYDYRARAGDDALAKLVDTPDGSALVLVCDVGGGTTDLSLLRVARSRTTGDALEVTRLAVGRHLLLGGDNMDLALAHTSESRLGEEALDPARFGQLVLACRAAKERLLSEDPPDEVAVTVLSPGTKLVGGTLRTKLARDEVEAIVLDGFFPPAARDAGTSRVRGGLVGFGLPYERDVAITHHVAAFFQRHAEGAKAPAALLLNGGVFHAVPIVARLASAVDGWGGPAVVVLPNADPDLAVARGAVAYGLSRRRRGTTIASGSARGYYVEVAAKTPLERAVVCVVPRGTEEGSPQVARGTTLALVVGRPARFDLFASDNARGHRAGDVLAWSDVELDALPPLFASFGAAAGGAESVPVVLEGELSAVGTLDLSCVELDPPVGQGPRRFRLAFNLRGDAARVGSPSVPPASRGRVVAGRPLDDAKGAVDRVFGKGAQDVAARGVKDLVRDLERLLGDRGQWDTAVTRTLFDAVWPGHKARRRSLDHERVFWQLEGYCLRPGVGDPGDASRLTGLVRLLPEKLAFADEVRGWQQFWFAWRRVAAGLDDSAQASLRDVVDPFLAPREAPRKKPKGWKPEAADAMLEMASSLERLVPQRRAELGAWIVERTWTDRDPRLWSALGRLGARVPAYATVEHVVSSGTAERWLDHLLREKWHELPTAAEAALRMARVTGDRARDVPERLRVEVAARLRKLDVAPEQVRTVIEYVEIDEKERATFFGEGLPVGLRLA
jgi:molecular chaperone DnaK (HSP70)